MAYASLAWNDDGLNRVFAGATLGRRSRRLKTALAHCRGTSWNLRLLAVDAQTQPPPPVEPKRLAEVVSASVLELAERCRTAPTNIEVLGLDGFLTGGHSGPLCAWVAERTGVTVVSGFEHRDVAGGGRGGPLDPLADWFLFRSLKLTRLLIHLGPSLRITVLPAGQAPDEIICFDAGPCCDFLDGLVRDLSQSRYPFDPSGHFAVQGRCSDELVAKWASHPFLLRSPPRFLDDGDFGEEFRKSSLTFAAERGLSARDVLCSASHFVVRSLNESIDRWLPDRDGLDEVLVSGGGLWNGLLWKLMTDSLGSIPVSRIDKLRVPAEARRAVHAAIFAFLAMDNVPGNLPALSGAAGPRILGQITPGSPENWDRWVCNLADAFDEAPGRAA
jgi:anhydro-N-acetylmuramic acid kinase